MIDVTYFPVATQHQLAVNRELVADKPYAHFFDERLVLHDDVLPALQAPMDPRHALSLQTVGTMADPGHHEVETGFCALPDGTAYVASLTHFPGATAEMFRWWFWWHSVEAARYTLWYPWNHVRAIAQNRRVLTEPGLSDEQRYIGNVHHVDEYIGPDLQRIAIEFVDPTDVGLDADRLQASGVRATACANVYLRRPWLRSGTMIHLARDTDDGFELRSRYWLADRVELGRRHPIDVTGLVTATGLRRRLAGERLALEQLLHDQVEFTHLAGFLPQIYAEFGPGA